MATAADIVAAYKIDRALAQSVVDVSRRVGIADPGWLANAIDFESGHTWSPKMKNPGSTQATGLIQFTSPRASQMGTSLSSLGQMSALQQMEYVARYFDLIRKERKVAGFGSQLDVYMAIFYPAAIGKGASYAFPAGIADQNHGIRTAQDYANLANKYAKLPTGALSATLATVQTAVSNVSATAGAAAVDWRLWSLAGAVGVFGVVGVIWWIYSGRKR